MGMFAYVWYSSLVRQMHVTVGSVLQTIVSGLSPQEQLAVGRVVMGRGKEARGSSHGVFPTRFCSRPAAAAVVAVAPDEEEGTGSNAGAGQLQV